MAASDIDAVIGSRREGDRTLYTWAAVVCVAVVLAGFARSYYAKTLFGAPALTTMQHLHGFVMTAWFVLFAVQVRLVATRRTPLHRRLGAYGAIVAAMVLIVGTTTAIIAAGEGRAPAGVPPLVFLAIPLGDMLLFAILFPAAILMRRRPEYHKRLMVVASLGILTAAIARIPVDILQSGGLPAFFALTDLIILAFIAADTWRHRRLHPAFAWAFGAVVLSQVLRFAIAGTPQFHAFGRWLTS